MKQKNLSIDDAWVLTRAGCSSRSFQDFLLKIAPQVPEKDRQKVEQASKILGPDGVDQLNLPDWIKPFASKIIQRVSREISSSMPMIAGELFGAGIFSLSEALYNVAKERGIKNESILRLIRMLPEFEALMYFMNVRKYYRDHCAHQLRVAVLGDFLLDLKSRAGNLEGLIKDKLDLTSEQVRTAWWFTGLLHDTGIPLAKLCTAINWSLLNEILRCYSSLDIKASPIAVNLAGDELHNKEYFNLLVEGMPKRWKEIVQKGLGVSETKAEPILFKAGYQENKEYRPEELHMDHGVVGAINFLKTLGEPEAIRKEMETNKPLLEAARAIALHNFKEELRNLPFEDFPLAFLLVLTDELQEWSRPVSISLKNTYFTTNLEKVSLLDSISYGESKESWDIPYTNAQAKKMAKFNFELICKDKEKSLKTLDCTEQFPDTEIHLRDVDLERPRKKVDFEIILKTA